MRTFDLVSIIIPMYNCSQHLRKCLDSVSHQLYDNIEVILVDDASTDETAVLCRSYANNDNRFRLILSPQNGGPAMARNRGIRVATGKFLIFLDSDDWLNKDAVDVLLLAQQSNQADFVVGSFTKIQDNNKTGSPVKFLATDQIITPQEICDYAACSLLEPNKYAMFHYCWGRLFSSSIIKEQGLFFKEDCRICEDIHFNFEYLQHVKKTFHVAQQIYNHTLGHPESAGMAFFRERAGSMPFYQCIWAAYANILSYIQKVRPDVMQPHINQIARHGHISHAIVLLVRACGHKNGRNRQIYKLVRNMAYDPTVRENLKYYKPLKGQSRLLPFLLKIKFTPAVIFFGRYKYLKRYGKQRTCVMGSHQVCKD